MRGRRFPCRVVRMTHTTETNHPYYSPMFFEGEGYSELMDILDEQGVDAAVEVARQWDFGNEHEDDYRDSLSDFGHEWEYGPVTADWSPTRYWLVVSRSAAYAYLVRDA